MSAEQNKRIVQEAYAAFGRQDIPALLNTLSNDVDWQAVIGASSAVPTSGRRLGRDAVATFFNDLAGCITFKQFEPREFIAEGDKVVVLGYYEGTPMPMGRGMSSQGHEVPRIRRRCDDQRSIRVAGSGFKVRPGRLAYRGTCWSSHRRRAGVGRLAANRFREPP